MTGFFFIWHFRPKEPSAYTVVIESHAGITRAECMARKKWLAWRKKRSQVTRGLTADNQIPCPTVKRSGVAYSCSYALLLVSITVAGVGLVTRLWLCLTVSPVYTVRSSHNRCTRQASGLWQWSWWCNGKAIEALAGRRPTARWLCLRKLIFVRLPLLP